MPGGATLARACREQRLRRSAGNSALSVGPGASRHPTKPAHSLNHFLTTLRPPNGALITGNVRAWAICPAALRLRGPTGNSASVGRARRHPTKPVHSLNHFITTLRVLDGGIANGSGGDTGRKICGESHHSLAITRASPGYFWSENQFSPK